MNFMLYFFNKLYILTNIGRTSLQYSIGFIQYREFLKIFDTLFLVCFFDT